MGGLERREARRQAEGAQRDAVRRLQERDVRPDTFQADELIRPFALDGRLALKLQTKFSKEPDRSLEVVDDDEDVVHPQ